MIDPVKTQIEQFLNTHQAAIQRLVQQAQQEAGGHYSMLSQAAWQQQIEIDTQEFIKDLLSGAPERTTLRQTQAGATRSTTATDIINMATAMDRLFAAYVNEQLQAQPSLAREIIARSSYVIARFRLSVSASQIDSLVRGKDQQILNPETPTP